MARRGRDKHLRWRRSRNALLDGLASRLLWVGARRQPRRANLRVGRCHLRVGRWCLLVWRRKSDEATWRVTQSRWWWRERLAWLDYELRRRLHSDRDIHVPWRRLVFLWRSTSRCRVVEFLKLRLKVWGTIVPEARLKDKLVTYKRQTCDII